MNESHKTINAATIESLIKKCSTRNRISLLLTCEMSKRLDKRHNLTVYQTKKKSHTTVRVIRLKYVHFYDRVSNELSDLSVYMFDRFSHGIPLHSVSVCFFLPVTIVDTHTKYIWLKFWNGRRETHNCKTLLSMHTNFSLINSNQSERI